MDAGKLIGEARAKRGLDQAELARRAATTQTYVSRIERGVVSPSVKTLSRLLHAMGLRLRLETESLPRGNVTAQELRRDLVDMTPEQRVEEAFELSAFLTEVAASAGDAPEDRDRQ